MLPTIAAVVGVRDEHELIARCIAHLEAQHVTSIVVVDNGSTDGTREILRDLQRQGRVALIETAGDPRRDSDYFARGIALAKERFTPDWILVQDADEFWVHGSGDLRQALYGESHDVVEIERFNACCCDKLSDFVGAASAELGTLSIHVEPLRLSRAAMDDDRSLRWISAQPMPKIAARGLALTAVSAGGHSAIDGAGRVLPARPRQDLIIVHLPFSSLERFSRKVQNAKAVTEQDADLFPGETAWHWKRWTSLPFGRDLEVEFEAQRLQPEVLSALTARGIVQRVDAFLLHRAPQAAESSTQR